MSEFERPQGDVVTAVRRFYRDMELADGDHGKIRFALDRINRSVLGMDMTDNWLRALGMGEYDPWQEMGINQFRDNACTYPIVALGGVIELINDEADVYALDKAELETMYADGLAKVWSLTAEDHSEGCLGKDSRELVGCGVSDRCPRREVVLFLTDSDIDMLNRPEYSYDHVRYHDIVMARLAGAAKNSDLLGIGIALETRRQQYEANYSRQFLDQPPSLTDPSGL